MSHSRVAAGAGALVPVLAVLGGCSTGTGVVTDVPYERPGWMTEQAQRQDEYRESLQSCVSAKGWNDTVEGNGAVTEPFASEDFPRWEVDRDACLTEMGVPDEPRMDRERAALLYERQVDTWRCVQDLGYDVAEPPSREAYVEELLGAGVTDWHPYGGLLGSLSQQEALAMEQECPQPWWAD